MVTSSGGYLYFNIFGLLQNHLFVNLKLFYSHLKVLKASTQKEFPS